jgi:hypothetical protein
MVYQLDLLSKTVLVLEKRLSLSEDKMTEVIDYLKTVDTTGKKRTVKTSTVIQTSNMLKDMPHNTLSATIQHEAHKNDNIEVGPNEEVSEEFMRERKYFTKV